jgi:hypothetical protein
MFRLALLLVGVTIGVLAIGTVRGASEEAAARKGTVS